MASKLITVYGRDIPAQVIARKGRTTSKIQLHDRFQVAIDRAAMRAGKGSSDQYLEDWRRVSTNHTGSPGEAARAEAERLEKTFDDGLLEKMIKAGGKSVAEGG